MSVTVVADFNFSEAALDAGLAALKEMLPATRAFQGCEKVEVAQGMRMPTHVLLIESWATKEDHRAYLRWRAESETNVALRDAMSAPPGIDYFDQRTDI